MLNLLQAAVEAAPEVPMIQQLQPFFMIGLMILVLWLFMWRPESKRRKEMTKFIDSLKNGDKIITAGGIHGTIKDVKETTVLIEVDNNVKIRINKSSIAASADAPAQK